MRNKYEKVILTIAVLTFIFTAGLSDIQANIGDIQDEENENYRTELILESLEDSDYETWQKLINSNSKIARKVSKKDFQQLILVRKLARHGKYEEALKESDKLKISLHLDNVEMKKIIESFNTRKIIT